MSDAYRLQAQSYVDGEWVGKPAPKLEQLTFQEYVFHAHRQPKGQCRENEVLCPICGCAGKEQVLPDRVRIYHPQRLHPCRAPEGYVPVLSEHERLVPA